MYICIYIYIYIGAPPAAGCRPLAGARHMPSIEHDVIEDGAISYDEGDPKKGGPTRKQPNN